MTLTATGFVEFRQVCPGRPTTCAATPAPRRQRRLADAELRGDHRNRRALGFRLGVWMYYLGTLPLIVVYLCGVIAGVVLLLKANQKAAFALVELAPPMTVEIVTAPAAQRNRPTTVRSERRISRSWAGSSLTAVDGGTSRCQFPYPPRPMAIGGVGGSNGLVIDLTSELLENSAGPEPVVNPDIIGASGKYVLLDDGKTAGKLGWRRPVDRNPAPPVPEMHRDNGIVRATHDDHGARIVE